MIGISDLKEYRAICAEIVRRENRVQQLAKHQSSVVQSSANFPYNLHSVSVVGVQYPPEADAERKTIALLKHRKRLIEEAVEEISQPAIRYAVQRKYLDSCFGERVTWDTIADELNDGNTSDAIRVKVKRYFRPVELKTCENER